MAINIQSLFADIIDTPEQRQQKLLQQGMTQGQLLSSGLRGRAAALAPLAQMAGQLGVQRQENLRRAVQPMLGIDPRTTGERMQERLSNIDAGTPEGLIKAAQEMQSIDPVRAAALRQAATELRKENEDRDLNRKSLQSQIGIREAQEQRAIEQQQYNISQRETSEAAALANLDLAELNLRVAENRAAETEAQTQAREDLRSELLNNIPDTEENAVTRALIPTMGLDQLQALGTGKDADIKEIEMDTVDAQGRSGKGIFVYDRNNLDSSPQFIGMKEFDDAASDYKPNETRINRFSTLITENEDLQDLLSDSSWGTDTNVPLRARALASALDRQIESGRTEGQAIADMRATSPENLRRGIIMPFGAAQDQGEWGIEGEGAPAPNPDDPAATPQTARTGTQPSPEAQRPNRLFERGEYGYNQELNNLFLNAQENPRASGRLNSLLAAKNEELKNKRQALGKLKDVPLSGSGLSAAEQRKRQSKIGLQGEIDLLETQIRRYTPTA